MLFNTLRSLSLATRLSVGFSSILLLLVAVAATGAYSVRTLGQHVQTIVQVNNVKTEVANELMSSIDNLAIQTRSVALFANLETDLDGKQAAAEVTLAQAAEERYLTPEKRLAALLAAPNASDAERALLAEVAAAAKVALPAIRTAVQQGSNRETEAAVLTLVNQVRPEESRMRHKVEELVVLQRKLTEEANTAMQDRLRMLVGGIRQAADSIQTASSEVAMGNQDLASARNRRPAACCRPRGQWIT